MRTHVSSLCIGPRHMVLVIWPLEAPLVYLVCLYLSKKHLINGLILDAEDFSKRFGKQASTSSYELDGVREMGVALIMSHSHNLIFKIYFF